MECEYDKRKKCDSLYIERYNKLLKENERLKEQLEVSRTNEETYRLEMLDITKRLGLDEETLFDDVKEKAERLNNIIKEAIEYINDRFYIDKETGGYHLTHTFDSSNLYELMKILDKGSE